jgi:hypothetical protein
MDIVRSQPSAQIYYINIKNNSKEVILQKLHFRRGESYVIRFVLLYPRTNVRARACVCVCVCVCVCFM